MPQSSPPLPPLPSPLSPLPPLISYSRVRVRTAFGIELRLICDNGDNGDNGDGRGGDVLVVVGSVGVISGCEWYGCRWTVCLRTGYVRQ